MHVSTILYVRNWVVQLVWSGMASIYFESTYYIIKLIQLMAKLLLFVGYVRWIQNKLEPPLAKPVRLSIISYMRNWVVQLVWSGMASIYFGSTYYIIEFGTNQEKIIQNKQPTLGGFIINRIHPSPNRCIYPLFHIWGIERCNWFGQGWLQFILDPPTIS